MSKNFLIIAAGGAAGNLVRNILLSSNDVDWPLLTDRHTTIMNQYPIILKENNLFGWWGIEHNLRFYNQYYGIDLNFSTDYARYILSDINKNKPIVFLNHSFAWGDNSDQLQLFSTNLKLLHVAPITKQGLEWQIRALHLKCLERPESMIDYSFVDNKDFQVKEFISKYGRLEYFKMNIINMREVTNRQQKTFLEVNRDIPLLPLEWLITADPTMITNKLVDIFGITLDINIVSSILTQWRQLHWNYSDTFDWEFAKHE